MIPKSKTRVGNRFLLSCVGLDRTDQNTMQFDGEIVRVTQPYGCPRNGTMGFTYVESTEGEFIGLVHLASLRAL